MAKFRQNHTRNGGLKGASIVKIILVIAVFVVILWFLGRTINSIPIVSEVDSEMDKVAVFDFSKDSVESLPDQIYIPAGSNGEIIHHKYYSLSYVEEYEQSEWVAYPLTKELIRMPNVPRAKRFEDDLSVSTGSATYYDYRGSGYSRGHLAPAADMAHNREAMEASFLMSNMSPQISSFNGGIWNELENLVRDWAYKYEEVIVVTGPILDANLKEFIGKNKVAVPDKFYKVILDMKGPETKAIGFILDNQKSVERLQSLAVTVDEVEKATGLDFYTYLLPSEEEEILESKVNVGKWKFDENLYRKRINVWNNR